jgi:hypothetical protein
MKKTNPIAARVEALPGRRLEAGWQQNLENVGGAFDRRPMEELWKSPNWSSKLTAENVIQNARLGVYGKPKENE